MKLLVNAPTGDQRLIEVGPGGGYFDPSRVLWDERMDGALPAITLGGMVRSGDTLVFDQARMDAHTAAIALSRPAMASQIDATVAAIYAKPSAFVKEYEAREAQARAFKAAGYTGTVPPRVQGFATPAAMTAQAASDLIIAQADQLLAALDLLSDLRMQKYAVTGAATDAGARTVFDSTMASIAAIAASLG